MLSRVDWRELESVLALSGAPTSKLDASDWPATVPRLDRWSSMLLEEDDEMPLMERLFVSSWG